MNIRKTMRIMSIELKAGWLASAILGPVYIFMFIYLWINTKDFELRISMFSLLVMYIFLFSFMIIFKATISKNNKIDKEVEQIVAILPIKEDERILGRLVNSGFILYMMIIPYITMYICTPSIPQNIEVRGGLTVLILYAVLWSTIRNISKYNEKYKILSRILGTVLLIILLIVYFASMMDSWRDIIIYLHASEVYMIIGNTYIGIILGIVTLIFFYYFNFRYVLKGIKNNRWQIR